MGEFDRKRVSLGCVFVLMILPLVHNIPLPNNQTVPLDNTVFVKELQSFLVKYHCQQQEIFAKPMEIELKKMCESASPPPVICALLVHAAHEICVLPLTMTTGSRPGTTSQLQKLLQEYQVETDNGQLCSKLNSVVPRNFVTFGSINFTMFTENDPSGTSPCRRLCEKSVTNSQLNPVCLLTLKYLEILRKLNNEVSKGAIENSNKVGKLNSTSPMNENIMLSPLVDSPVGAEKRIPNTSVSLKAKIGGTASKTSETSVEPKDNNNAGDSLARGSAVPPIVKNAAGINTSGSDLEGTAAINNNTKALENAVEKVVSHSKAVGLEEGELPETMSKNLSLDVALAPSKQSESSRVTDTSDSLLSSSSLRRNESVGSDNSEVMPNFGAIPDDNGKAVTKNSGMSSSGDLKPSSSSSSTKKFETVVNNNEHPSSDSQSSSDTMPKPPIQVGESAFGSDKEKITQDDGIRDKVSGLPSSSSSSSTSKIIDLASKSDTMNTESENYDVDEALYTPPRKLKTNNQFVDTNSEGSENKPSMFNNEISGGAIENENDSGFLGHALLLVVISGLCWLLFHNRKRVIAMAVEGRRPKNGRRRSSSGSYRKLENNFD